MEQLFGWAARLSDIRSRSCGKKNGIFLIQSTFTHSVINRLQIRTDRIALLRHKHDHLLTVFILLNLTVIIRFPTHPACIFLHFDRRICHRRFHNLTIAFLFHADLHRIHDMHQERKIIFPFRDIEVYKITSRPVVMQERTRYIFCLRNQFMRHHTFCQNLLLAANIKEITSHRQTFAVPRICHIHWQSNMLFIHNCLLKSCFGMKVLIHGIYIKFFTF